MPWGIAGDGGSRRPSKYRVLMTFQRVVGIGWKVQFLDADCRNTYPLRLRFEYPDKILEMFERWGADRDLKDRQALEFHLQRGRGKLWLELAAEEHQKLQTPK
jgi:hypothetical protein